ncbi:MAG TPA: hypothetical protein VF587_11940 [Solirubrobacteraceae bacterium]|jgi:hypothetical protein
MRTAALLVSAAALLASGAAPATAQVGFAAPVAVTPAGGHVQLPAADVGPTGRAATVWMDAPARGRFTLRAKLGPSPAALGPTAIVERRRHAWEPLVAVGADGAAVACWPIDPIGPGGRRRAGVRCATAAPEGGFGPPRWVRRLPARARPSVKGLTFDGAGRAVVAWTEKPVGNRRRLMWAATGPDGAFGPGQALLETDTEGLLSLGAGPDGAVVAGYSTRRRGLGTVQRRPFARVLAPGAAAFGPPIDLSPEGTVYSVEIAGGRGLAALFDIEYEGPHVALRGADGSFRAPVRLGPPELSDEATLEFLPDGSAVVGMLDLESANTDCGDYTRGLLTIAPMTADGEVGPAQPMSAPRQIVLGAALEALDDGTVVAVWGNERGARSRLEYAVRAPGASSFAEGAPLPLLSADEVVLAGGGQDALLVWIAGRQPDGPARLIVSALRRSPPFAPVAGRPSRPQTNCT